MKTVFHPHQKKKKNPILLLSQRRLPFVLQATNYFPVASEGDSATWLQNQRTGAGGVEGGGSRGQMERKEIQGGKDGWRKRAWEKEGKSRGKMPDREQITESGVSQGNDNMSASPGG